jgi:hypothetical protein
MYIRVMPAALILALSMGVAAPKADVRLYVSTGEYYGVVYVPPARHGADHVHLRGQPLSLRVSIQNHGKRVAIQAYEPILVVTARAETGDDSSPPIRTRATVVEGSAATVRGQPVPLTFPLTLERSGSVTWRLVVEGLENAPAGIYRLEVVPSLRITSASGESHSTFRGNNDSLRIDLRDVTSTAERIELLRIEATRAYTGRDFLRCRRFAAQLLAMHPWSVFGELLIADTAAARGDRKAAAAGYRRSLRKLETGEDQLMIQNTGPLMAEELTASVRKKLSAFR